MPRYIIRRRASEEEEDDWALDKAISRELEVDDSQPIDTGLLDMHGNKIMRAPNPIGFHAEVDE